jgi:HSP20 family molecular chaperone IbpA
MVKKMFDSEKIKNTKSKFSRISIPGRIINLLLHDDEFFREVSTIKKVGNTNGFPKYDQWCDVTGFHMEFALAGYSAKDLEIVFSGNELTVRSTKNTELPQEEMSVDHNHADDPKDDLKSNQSPRIHHGAIVRGIARRNFSTSFFVSQEYDISATKASIQNGLLHLLIPVRLENKVNHISISNGE